MMNGFPSAGELLRRFVSSRTINGHEKPLALEIAALLSDIGFRVEVADIDDDRANVYAEMGQGPCLTLCGHLDVVTALGDWRTDPFELADCGDSYAGRGCADMKGGVAAMVRAAAEAAQRGLPRGMKLALLFVADEEKDNLGMRAFLSSNTDTARVCVIGEPTDMEVAIAHKGVARFRADIHGRAAHSSMPGAGRSALVGAARAILAVEEASERLSLDRHPILPPRTMCVTKARGGEQDNIVPGAATLIIDHRLFPGDTYEIAASRVRDALDSAGGLSYDLAGHCYLPGGGLPREHPWVRAACRIAGRALGRACAPVEFRASCEQALMLEAGIPTIILGPGSLMQAHTTDETLPKAQLAEAVRVYGALIEGFGKEKEGIICG